MRRNEIRIGGFYTKNEPVFAREVIGNDGEYTLYRDYSLHDGKPISTLSKCSCASFANWAERECTPAEKARCNVAAMERRKQEESDAFSAMMEMPVKHALFDVLDAIKVEYVVEYLLRKGYKVAKADEPS
jgi:hypothetical protein